MKFKKFLNEIVETENMSQSDLLTELMLYDNAADSFFINAKYHLAKGEKLTSLPGLPEKIHGSLYISSIGITSLEGIPEYIEDYCYIEQCYQLTSIRGLKQTKGLQFIRNTSLTELDQQVPNLKGDFNVIDCRLKSFKNFPQQANNVLVKHTHISELKGITRMIAGSLSLTSCRINSLLGISDEIDEMVSLVIKQMDISSGGLELLLIKNLVFLNVVDCGHGRWFDIVNKYLTPDSVGSGAYDCQRELIEAGYEEYAQL